MLFHCLFYSSRFMETGYMTRIVGFCKTTDTSLDWKISRKALQRVFIIWNGLMKDFLDC